MSETSNFLAVIEKAVFNPEVDIAKLSQLLDVQERILSKNAETEFNISLAEMQPSLPQVEKEGTGHNSKYAKFEHIMEAIGPLLAKHGFSISYSTEMQDKQVIVTGKLSHRAGHSQSVSIPLPLDTSGNKQAIQAMGSTLSYGRRYALGLLLNIVTKDEDDDGKSASAGGFISHEQAVEIDLILRETKSDIPAFLKWIGADSVPEVTAKNYARAIAFLRKKQNAKN